jgi:hypothetical protein
VAEGVSKLSHAGLHVGLVVCLPVCLFFCLSVYPCLGRAGI